MKRKIALGVVAFVALSTVSATAGAVVLLLAVVAWVVSVIYQTGVAAGFERGTVFGQELCDVAPEWRMETPVMVPAEPVRETPPPSYREAIARYTAPPSEASAAEDIHS